MRLVESSDPDAVTRYNVRAHYTQRLVLTAAVCHELKRAPDGTGSTRPKAALELLAWWMQTVYDLPHGRDIKYGHGLDDPKLAKFASDMTHELQLGASVCDALATTYTADKQWELDADITRMREQLSMYVATFDN